MNPNNNQDKSNNFNFSSSNIGSNNFFNNHSSQSGQNGQVIQSDQLGSSTQSTQVNQGRFDYSSSNFNQNSINSTNQSQQISTTLNVPVTSPTHFDFTHSPASNNINQSSNSSQTDPESTEKKDGTYTKKDLKKFVIMSTVFGILAVIFLFVGIGGFLFGSTQADQLTKTKIILAEKQNIITAVEQSSGVSPINSVEQVPVYQTTLGYIYISDWRIKIKVPENLKNLGYILNQQSYRPSICFNGLSEGVQTYPAFANIATNPGGMGCLSRIEARDGNTDANTGKSFGTLVFTHEGFNYFYAAPEKDFSTDASELGLEKTAVQIIKNMLTANISTYQ